MRNIIFECGSGGRSKTSGGKKYWEQGSEQGACTLVDLEWYGLNELPDVDSPVVLVRLCEPPDAFRQPAW